MGADQARHRRRTPAGADPRAHRARTLRSRVPGALHERGPARQLRCGRRRLRPARSRRRASLQPRPRARARPRRLVVGPHHAAAGAVAYRRRRSVPLWRIHDARRAPRQTRASIAEGTRGRVHARVGGSDHRNSRRDDSPPRARDGRHRARSQDRAADRLDRLVGPRARDRHRQPGRLSRDARPRRALESASRRSAHSRS